MMKAGLYEFCVSTILDRRRLEEYALKGRGTATEGRAWKPAQVLWQRARDAHEKMPVIFSDAAYNAENLLLWGVLQEIDIDGKGDRTAIRFSDLNRIPGNHHRTELIVRSSGKSIAPQFIRPCAICRTPPFLK